MIHKDKPKSLEFFTKVIQTAANSSICENKKVGSCIVSYNETKAFTVKNCNRPAGRNSGSTIDEDNDTLEDIVHAEMSVLLGIMKSPEKYLDKNNKLSMFCTSSPCMNCAKHIVYFHKNIKPIESFYFLDIHKNSYKSSLFLVNSGIPTFKIKDYQIEIDFTRLIDKEMQEVFLLLDLKPELVLNRNFNPIIKI